MLKKLHKFVSSRRKKPAPYRAINRLPAPRLIVTEASLHAMRECVATEIALHHEGITYLLGQTNGTTTIVIGAIRPNANTTRGSFEVSSVAMARVVRTAASAGLDVVGQLHTHPTHAYHSEGDEEGARIAYNGYVSIVVPDYGHHLPSLAGAAIYFYRNRSFTQLGAEAIRTTDGKF